MPISSTGIGSGLDVSSIVSQLVALERKPIDNLQTAAKDIETRISAYGKVQSLMSTLRDSAAALASPTLWKQGTATVSDPTVASATTSAGVSVGDYSLTVSHIARAQTLYSRAVSSLPAVLGAGSMTIQIVSDYGPPPQLKDGADPVSLDFSDPNTTVQQVRDRINASGAGVTATVVRDASGAVRLALTSKSTGLDNRIMITGTGGMADFSYSGTDPDPSDPVPMRQGQAAQNAELMINGVPITSSTNQITDAVDGVTLNLTKESATPVMLSVSNDTAAQQKAVQDFMTAYNGLNAYLVQQTRYDAATKTAATLQGDSAALSLRGQMRNLLFESNGASPAFSQLRSVGLTLQQDGSLKLDSAKLTTALQQPAEVGKLFASTDAAVTANNGFGVRFRELADRLTGTGGLLSARTEGLQSSLKRNQSDQEKLEERVARTRARLERQYQMLDTKMAALTGLSTYVAQQITTMNNSSS